MAKYTYLLFVKSEKNIPSEWTSEVVTKWNTEHHKICHEKGFKLLFWGESHGAVEDSVFAYESDMGLDVFNDFLNRLRRIEPKSIAYVRTMSVVNVPTNIGVEDKSLHF